MDAGRALPEDFGELLLRALDPADEEEAAALILQAAGLPDPELAAFLDAFAERVRTSEELVRAAELRSWLAGGPPAGAGPRPQG